MINQFELRKIYIAELGFDPHFQMALRSENKVKTAKKEIQRIVGNNQDPYEAEGELLKMVKRLALMPRQKEYAGFLLEFGFWGFKDKYDKEIKPIVSAEAYEYARENYFGVKDIDDETKEKIDSMKKKKLQINPFEILSGEQQWEDPTERLKKIDSQPQIQQNQNPNPMDILSPNIQ